MGTLWTKEDPELGLKIDHPFKVAYPRSYDPLVETGKKDEVTDDQINEIVGDIFQHPSLDLTSIFHNIRASDEQLSQTDSAAIQTLLQEYRADMKLLDNTIKEGIASIVQLSRQLTQASCRLVQKASQIRLCEYLLSPPKLKDLPQDILEQIFWATLATNEGPRPDPSRPPLLFTAVCHRWRVIAYSTPTLWANIHIGPEKALDLAKAWAKRCRIPSLTIDLHRNNAISLEKLQELFVEFQASSVRLRKLDIRSGNSDSAKIISDFLSDPDQDMFTELVDRNTFRSPDLPSPSIKRLYAFNPPISWDTSPPPSQLTVLWITKEIHWETLEFFLSKCPNLESLYVSLAGRGVKCEQGCSDSFVRDHKGGTIPHLQYFGFCNDCKDEDLPQSLLRDFSFPSLRVLECYLNKRGDGTTPWVSSHSLITQVRRLSLQFEEPCDVTRKSLLSLLQPAISVEELAISAKGELFPEIIGALVSVPAGQPGEASILPSLKRLHFGREGEISKWMDLAPQLGELGQAWTTPPSIQRPIHTLTYLVFQYWGSKDSPPRNIDAPILRNAIRELCPNLSVRFISYSTVSWFWDVPTTFGMFPVPFNEIRSHEASEGDEIWTTKFGSGYFVN
ncbi:hypothetical protein BDN72DRAFT_845261 [Pluteus cervinus]|uniref:Uncharacterized protein n=1 Tax=Pluteus cervinus TaxID=181527 RepID=A0ACD3AJA3_9AGAR|nr:hypothetical protein BDN72DRAFT_845261 [Pluteus cervinus]